MSSHVILGMKLGPHASFIVGAYAIAIAVVVLLIGWVAIDHIAQKRRLAKLEASGGSKRLGASR